MCTRPLLGGEGPGNKARVHTAHRHTMQQIKCFSGNALKMVMRNSQEWKL